MKDQLPDLDWHRVISLGLRALIVIVVAPFLVYAFPQLVGASNSYVVLSNSMYDEPAPVLQAGDVIFVYDTPASEIEAGEVITYRSGEGPATTHRVVEVQNEDGSIQYVTKGDANEEADKAAVSASRVVGTVGFHIPMLGRVIVFAGTTEGIFLLLIIPSMLLILSELSNIRDIVSGTEDEPTVVDASPEETGSEDT